MRARKYISSMHLDHIQNAKKIVTFIGLIYALVLLVLGSFTHSYSLASKTPKSLLNPSVDNFSDKKEQISNAVTVFCNAWYPPNNIKTIYHANPTNSPFPPLPLSPSSVVNSCLLVLILTKTKYRKTKIGAQNSAQKNRNQIQKNQIQEDNIQLLLIQQGRQNSARICNSISYPT